MELLSKHLHIFKVKKETRNKLCLFYFIYLARLNSLRQNFKK